MKLIVGVGSLWGAAILAGCHGEALNPNNGRCGPSPRLLVSAASFPAPDAASERAMVSGLAVDGSDLYFATGTSGADPSDPVALAAGPGALIHVSTFGGAATQIASDYDFVQTPLVTPMSVIVGVTSTSSTADPSILSVPRSGGMAVPLVALTGDSLLTLPVTDGTSVYFTDGAGVESIPLAPAASPASPTLVSSEHPVSLGVFGQRLLLLTSTGQVEGIPIGSNDAGQAGVLGSGFADPVSQSLIACGASACWLAGGAVEQMDPAGGPVTAVGDLPASVTPPSVLLFDGTSFFVLGGSSPTATSNGAIARMSQQGGAPVIVATLPPLAGGLAVDDACVYFSTSTGIFSLLKNVEGAVVP